MSRQFAVLVVILVGLLLALLLVISLDCDRRGGKLVRATFPAYVCVREFR